MEKIKLFLANFKIKHHSCKNHAELIDSYTNSVNGVEACPEDKSSGSWGSWITTSYKCKICGKIWDID